jgi:hypothetical protein
MPVRFKAAKLQYVEPMPPERARPLVTPAKHDTRVRIAAWITALMLVAGCRGDAASDDATASCRPSATPMPKSGGCVVPLDPSSRAASPACAATWEGPTTAVCHSTPGTNGNAFDYSGPSGGYLVKALNGQVGGWMCVYDAANKALVARYEYSDFPSYCCRSSFDEWQGRAIREAWPERLICEALPDGGVETDAAGAATHVHD